MCTSILSEGSRKSLLSILAISKAFLCNFQALFKFCKSHVNCDDILHSPGNWIASRFNG